MSRDPLIQHAGLSRPGRREQGVVYNLRSEMSVLDYRRDRNIIEQYNHLPLIAFRYQVNVQGYSLATYPGSNR